MRALLLLFAALSLSGCASAPAVAQDQIQPALESRIRFFITHEEGQPLEVGLIFLEAESADETWTRFSVDFYDRGEDLGAPRGIGWGLALGADYCRDEPTWVEAVLTAPSGEIWRSERREVPAGPGWPRSSSRIVGSRTLHNQPDLRTAIIQGGLFKIALENSQGERWQETLIDTLDPATRERLYDEELAALRQIDPASYPVVREERQEPPRLPAQELATTTPPCPSA